MKQVWLFVLSTLLAVSTAKAEGPEDQYIAVYNLIQEADSLEKLQPSQALEHYLQAQSSLQRLQRVYPDWNTKVVGFRLNYLALKVQTLSAHAAPRTNAVANAQRATAAAQQSAAPNEADRQVNELKQYVRQLEADKVVLEAKLKEAFAAQPLAVDPRELSNAVAQAKALEKENELLKVTLSQERARVAGAAAAKPGMLSASEANQKLAEQTERADRLSRERDALQAQLKTVSPGTGTASLQAENALLRKQIADLKAAPAAGAANPEVARMADAQKQIAALQADRDTLRMEKAALESRLKQSPANSNAPPMTTAKVNESARVKELEGERNQLQKKLDQAMKELYSRKGKALTARLEGLEGQIFALRSRLEIFEARKIPYTEEELAMLKKPEPQMATTAPAARTGRKSTRDLPPGTTALVAEAQKFFSAHQFEKAEQNYLQVLSKDQTNVPTLANLAVIQMQLDRMTNAEQTILQAVKIDPDDAYSWFVLGQVRFRQEKYDDALDALSRSAKLDPQNAQIQNLLGLTLSQKGLRGPAETALRKAIQIDPGFADAHNNLAVVYLGQDPPLVELARWHYQKARAAGNPPNPFLEKAFETKKTASTTH